MSIVGLWIGFYILGYVAQLQTETINLQNETNVEQNKSLQFLLEHCVPMPTSNDESDPNFRLI
jgi:hypothetical protein